MKMSLDATGFHLLNVSVSDPFLHSKNKIIDILD